MEAKTEFELYQNQKFIALNGLEWQGCKTGYLYEHNALMIVAGRFWQQELCLAEENY